MPEASSQKFTPSRSGNEVFGARQREPDRLDPPPAELRELLPGIDPEIIAWEDGFRTLMDALDAQFKKILDIFNIPKESNIDWASAKFSGDQNPLRWSLLDDGDSRNSDPDIAAGLGEWLNLCESFARLHSFLVERLDIRYFDNSLMCHSVVGVSHTDLLGLSSFIESISDRSTAQISMASLKVDSRAGELMRAAARALVLASEFTYVTVDYKNAPRMKRLSDNERSEVKFEEIDEIKKKSLSSLREIQVASGSVAVGILGSEFDVYAKAQGKIAAIWTFAAIVGLLFTLAIGFGELRDRDEIDWRLVLARLALTLPVLAISTYCARLASQSRENSRHASWTALQLRTVRAYTDDLDVEDKASIRLTLGSRVYSRPDFIEGGDSDGVSLLPPDVVKLLEKALGSARSSEKDE